jgi:CPA1 family monovalent cation:H+ antiporter
MLPATKTFVCAHHPAEVATAQADACQECGSTVNLRMCAGCGHVGCCESQAGHGRAHALSQGHPIIYSVPVGRGFAWCYEENRYL